MFRLRGKGVKPVRGGPVGDLLCRAVVETPVNLTREQRALLEEFRSGLEAGGERQSPRQTSWFEGVKKLLRWHDRMTIESVSRAHGRMGRMLGRGDRDGCALQPAADMSARSSPC